MSRDLFLERAASAFGVQEDWMEVEVRHRNLTFVREKS